MAATVRRPVGADDRWKPGDKQRRLSKAEAARRNYIARRFSMTQEERDLEDEHHAALKVSGAQFWEDYRTLGSEEASRLARIRTDELEAEHQRKLDALPPEKRSSGTYDVNTFDFDAHERAQNEAFKAMTEKMFPPSKEGPSDASRS